MRSELRIVFPSLRLARRFCPSSLGVLGIGVVVVAGLGYAQTGSPPPAAQQGAAPSGPADLHITIDTSGASTRLVIASSRAVSASVDAMEGRLAVVFGEPVRTSPAAQRLGDPILGGWRMEGDRTLVLETGGGYETIETFQLRNPWRLVLDLQGRRGNRAGGDSGAVAGPMSIIVIDPGHGGVESGAVGRRGLKEKDVTLDLARRLQAALRRDPALTVVLTRDDDRQVGLDERTAIANHNRAELFVSIHLNSSPSRDTGGAETYYLASDATDDEARTLAALENRSFDDRAQQVQGETAPGRPEERSLELILWDLAQNQFLAESSQLAESVQREMNALAGTRDRGVRQAPFRVLMGATMPAILVEVGFLSNPAEEAKLAEGGHRDRIVEALAGAVLGFRQARAQVVERSAESADLSQGSR